jgi:DNA-binding MarR family transcriptional regulator
MGLLTRTRSTEDERILLVSLTPAGAALRAEAEKIPSAVVARLGASLDELEQLRRVLTRVNDAAIAAGALT